MPANPYYEDPDDRGLGTRLGRALNSMVEKRVKNLESLTTLEEKSLKQAKDRVKKVDKFAGAISMVGKKLMWMGGVVVGLVSLISIPFKKLGLILDKTRDAMGDLGIIGLSRFREGIEGMIEAMGRGMAEAGAATQKTLMRRLSIFFDGEFEPLRESLDRWFFITNAQSEVTEDIVMTLRDKGVTGIGSTLDTLSQKLWGSGVNVDDALGALRDRLKDGTLNVDNINNEFDNILASILATGGTSLADTFRDIMKGAKTFDFAAIQNIIGESFGAVDFQTLLSGGFDRLASRIQSLDEHELQGLANAMGTTAADLIFLGENWKKASDHVSKLDENVMDQVWQTKTLSEKFAALRDIFITPLIDIANNVLVKTAGGFEEVRAKAEALGKRFGVFIHDHLDEWIDKLPKFWNLFKEGIITLSVAATNIGARLGIRPSMTTLSAIEDLMGKEAAIRIAEAASVRGLEGKKDVGAEYRRFMDERARRAQSTLGTIGLSPAGVPIILSGNVKLTDERKMFTVACRAGVAVSKTSPQN